MAAEVRAADLPEGLPIAGRDAVYIKTDGVWRRIDRDPPEGEVHADLSQGPVLRYGEEQP